jgi:hypothetical protein
MCWMLTMRVAGRTRSWTLGLGPCERRGMRDVLFAFVVFLCVLGCGGRREFVGTTPTGREPNRFERHALTRARTDLQCEPSQLVVFEIGGGGYRIEGCSRFATYTCLLTPGGFAGRVTCVPSSQGVLVPAGAVAAQPAPQAIAAVPAATELPPPPPPPPPVTAETTAARGAIAARAESILACSSGQAVAVDATWDAAGVMIIALAGEQAGTPVEECVRAALAASIVSPAGNGGRVLAAVQR